MSLNVSISLIFLSSESFINIKLVKFAASIIKL